MAPAGRLSGRFLLVFALYFVYLLYKLHNMKLANSIVLTLFVLGGCAQPRETAAEQLPQDSDQEEPAVENPSEEVFDDPVWAMISDGDKNLNPRDYSKVMATSQAGVYTQSRNWSGCSWKNDHVSSRIDILTQEEAFPGAVLDVEDLVSENGAVISKDNISATYINAIHSKSEAYPDIDYDIYDVITHSAVKDLEAGNLYSAWVDIYVPAGTPAGTYTGRVSLKSAQKDIAVFKYSLDVLNLTLTNPEEWETFLDLWETPFASNRYYSGKTNMEFFNFTTPERQDTNPFSLYYVRLDPKYQAGLESELELYHKAGGNTISVQTVEGPDNSRFPCATPSMIKWILQKDGTYRWDYTDMDYYVELNLKHGINRQIDLFYHTGVGWGFVYYDESTGEVTNKLSAQPGQERWKTTTHAFLTDLVAHLEEKGWFDMAVLYMDERLYDVTLALVEAAEDITNSKGVQLKVGGAVNGKEVAPLYDRMYDVSIWENARPSDAKELARSRRAKGLQTTLYSCGSGKMASTCQPAEAAFAVYEAKKYGMDGVMRWALNKYDEDPLYGTLHTTCYPGDCYLIYPDERNSAEMKAQSSPRFEKLCEGMRYTEKLNLIRKLYPGKAAKVDEIVSSLKSSMVKEAASMRDKVNELSREVQ